jgi:betaine-aldehyde dehydrogenase
MQALSTPAISRRTDAGNATGEALNLIGGAWRPASSGAFLETHNPATGEVTGRVADGGVDDAEEAILAAYAAFSKPSWSRTPRLRQLVLSRWASRLEENVDALAMLLTFTNGKPLVQARGEIGAAISEIRYYAGLARHVTASNMEVSPGEFATMLREPAGVAGIIVPWNAPAVLLVRSLAPALAVGCTAVVKLAHQTAVFTAAFLRHLHDVPDMPAGVVNTIHEAGHRGSERLVLSDRVDVISFTGSTAVGKQIMVAAAATVKKLSLELGGKSCAVVMDDADIATVAGHLARAATIISGQQCTAARRVLVHASRHAEMAEQLARALSSLKVGDGRAPDTQMGPLIDVASRNAIDARTRQVFDEADEVLLRGSVPEGAADGTAYLTPSLVAHSDDDASFCQEEIFGPLVVLERFEDEAEAVRKANNTVFGLSSSVWTGRHATALRVARELRRGTVWINDHNKLFAEAETGGYRQSGLGRLHGYDALADFTELKHIYQNVGTIDL